MGQRQFEEFFEEQLVLAKKLIDDFIKSNNMKLPGRNNFQKSQPKKVLTPVTVSKLKSSFECKQKEVLELFQQELFRTAQSIAKDEFSLYHDPIQIFSNGWTIFLNQVYLAHQIMQYYSIYQL